MKTTAQVQEHILQATGIKTSVKKLTGSMKGYVSIRPMFQNGYYPKYPFEFTQGIKKELTQFGGSIHPVFTSDSYIDIYGIENDAIKMKTERKPKPISEQTVKTWGSKNSQLRLDKATARNAKKLKAGTTARYY